MPTDFHIRPFQGDDLADVQDLVWGIQNGEFGLGFQPHEQPDLLDIEDFYQDGGFWVAESEGELIGTIGLQRLDEGTGVLRKMFLQKSWRSHPSKPAQRLYDVLLIQAQELKLKRILLDTPSVARAAQRFYLKNGFREIKKEDVPPNFTYPDRYSLLFQLDLKDNE